jgi:hypothetical protein
MRSIKVLLVGILGLAAFASFASAANASTITANSSSYTGVATRTLTLDPGGLGIVCDLTFVLGLRATSVTAASLVASLVDFGTVRGTTGACDGGFVVTLLNQPWRYDALVSGGAGNVTATTGLIIKNAQFSIRGRSGIPSCLYQGDVGASINAAGTQLNINSSVPLVSGIACPAPGRLSGNFAVVSGGPVVLTLS